MDAKNRIIYNNYLEHLLIKGLAKTTTDLYDKEAKLFLESIDDLKTLSTAKVMDYLSKYSILSPSSKNQHYSSLRAFLKYISKNVDSDFKNIKIPYIKDGRKLPEILDQSEFIKKLDALKESTDSSDDWIKKRDYALVILLYATGMRVSEALSFSMDDIHEDQWVRIDNGKGLKDRFVPIADGAIEALKVYVKTCPFSNEKSFSKAIKVTA
jgi:site-specific recombinase XerD